MQIRRINVFGGPGSGKCFGKDTEILMFDGSIKKVQDVQIGELVMGPDSEPRRVLTTAKGRESLYRVHQKCWGSYKPKSLHTTHPYCSNSYVVNESHILTIKRGGLFRKRNDLQRMKLSVFDSSGPGRKQCPCGVFIARIALDCPKCSAKFGECKTSRYQDHFSRCGDVYNISVRDYLKESNKFKQVMKGYRASVNFVAQDVKIDPYFLGLWLGDGSSRTPSITNIDEVIVNYVYEEAQRRKLEVRVETSNHKRCPTYHIAVKRSNREEITEDAMVCYRINESLALEGCKGSELHHRLVKTVSNELRSLGWYWLEHDVTLDYVQRKVREIRSYIKKNNHLPISTSPNYTYGNSLRNDMNYYGLLGNKHIPAQYLHNSREARLALLAGIIDTDGHLCNPTSYEISTKSSVLAKDIVYLARSLGFAANARESWKRATNGSKEKKLYWRIMLGGDKCDEIPVRIQHKKSVEKRVHRDPLTYQFVVEALGEGEYYGFSVDKDHLFLLGDFTVVHNSTLAPRIFVDLKIRGYSVELVREWIKMWAYEGRVPQSHDQQFVFSNQLHEEDVFLRHVPLIVSDSPLLMNNAYSKFYGYPHVAPMILQSQKFDREYPALNFFIDRTVTYRQEGRYQNIDQAVEFDVFLLNFLKEYLEGSLIHISVDDFEDVMSMIERVLRMGEAHDCINS
jgi:hypothetical protein